MRLELTRHAGTLRRLTLLTLPYLFPLLAAIRQVIDPDIWWHLRTGEWIIEHGTVPRMDPFSSFGMGKPWVAYTWLFDVMVYGLYQAFGLVGIVLLTTVLSLLIAAALHRLIRRFALPLGVEALLTANGLLALMLLLSPRPWLFTVLFFIVELDLILLARRSANSRFLRCLPPLFIVWANIHIQFCYGLLLLGLAMAEPLLYKIFPQIQQRSVVPPIPFPSCLRMLLLCSAATLITPYHFHLYSTIMRYIRETGVFEIILEFQPLPFREPWSWIVLFTALAGAFSLGWRRDVRPFPLLCLIAGAFLSFRTRRDIWFIVVTAIAIIAESIRNETGSAKQFQMTKRRVAIVTVALIAAAVAIGWKRDIFEARLESVVAENYPAAAVAVVKERGISGPLYNDFDWGGYLIWRLRTIPVAMDNRTNVHGDERIRRSVETWAGLNHWDADPELVRASVIIASQRKPLASLLRLNPRFELLYADKLAVVFVARTRTAVDDVTTSQPGIGRHAAEQPPGRVTNATARHSR